MTALLIDCDPGTDDAIALLFAFASPELDVRLITTVGGNTGLANTTRNACALVGLAGKTIPVVAGSAGPLLGAFSSADHVHGVGGIGGVALPGGPPAAPGIAADAIRAALRSAPDGLTLVGIGPATNIAIALATEPALAEKVKEIVLMTGAWAEGNVTPAAEFNAWSDPEALAIVLACGRPVTLATLELTAQALATPAWLASLRARGAGRRCLNAAADIIETVPLTRRHDFIGAPQHDLCAIAWLALPSLFESREAFATADVGDGPSRGRTNIDRWDGRGHRIRLLTVVDGQRLFGALADRLASLP